MDINGISAGKIIRNGKNSIHEKKCPRSENDEKNKSFIPSDGEYGRVLLKTNSVSFGRAKTSSAEPDKIEYYALTREEFFEYKKKIAEKLKSMPEHVRKNIKVSDLNEYNIFLADKILSDERLYGNDDIVKYSERILYSAKREENAEAKLNIIDKMLSDERLYQNETVMKKFPDFIANTMSNEVADMKINLADILLSNPDLLSSPDLTAKSADIIINTNNDVRFQIAKKVLSDKDVYSDKTIIACAENIIENTDTTVQKEFASEIFADEKYYHNPNVMQFSSKVTEIIKRKSQIETARKILSDERIYNNSDFMKTADDIISDFNFSVQNECFNTVISDEKLFTDETLMKHVTALIDKVRTPAQKNFFDKIISDERLYSNNYLYIPVSNLLYNMSWDDSSNLLSETTDKILNDESLSQDKRLMNGLGKVLEYVQKENTRSEALKAVTDKECIKSVKEAADKVCSCPVIYINGEYSDENAINEKIDRFFADNYYRLLLAADTFDDETINHILRKRFDDAETFLGEFTHGLTSDDRGILKGLNNVLKVKNGEKTPFTPADKADFMYILYAYDKAGCDKTVITDMIAKGEVDIVKINSELYKKLSDICNLNDEEIKNLSQNSEKSFDNEYLHLLIKELFSSRNPALRDLIKASASDSDFKSYISRKDNEYAQINERTAKLFSEAGLDYEKWLNPSSNNNIIFTAKDKNNETLLQIANQITEDIEELRKTPAKGVADKKFSSFIKEDKFVITPEISANKEKLRNFVKNCMTMFEPLFKRAEVNINNPEKRETALRTLTVKSHLLQRMDDIEKVDMTKSKKTNNIDLTVKMWDRKPQKDIFQGNYSTCCIGMNNENASAMPHYLLNGAYNMIELTDNKSGNTIGNALCYFVKDEKETPVFIVDNIEIKNSMKPSDEIGKELRNAITQYASNIAKEVTGKDDIPIYMSGCYNDVPCNDLPKYNKTVTLLGEIDCKEIYMDLYGGWTDKFRTPTELQMLKIKNQD